MYTCRNILYSITHLFCTNVEYAFLLLYTKQQRREIVHYTSAVVLRETFATTTVEPLLSTPVVEEIYR